MKSDDPKFQQMVGEIQQLIGRRVDKEWDEPFGSAVMVTLPRGGDHGDSEVTGWVHPDEARTATADLLMQGMFSLAVTILLTQEVDAGQLLGVVMKAATDTGKAIIVDADDPFGGMTQN